MQRFADAYTVSIFAFKFPATFAQRAFWFDALGMLAVQASRIPIRVGFVVQSTTRELHSVSRFAQEARDGLDVLRTI